MDTTAAAQTVRALWDAEILPSLQDFITIPALSPAFDDAWAANGNLDAAVEHLRTWIAKRNIPGATIEVVRLPERTPLLFVDIPATDGVDNGTVLLYGHLDKQPPVGGWSEGLGPWTPVLRDGKLFGRGASDDGYAGYAATAAIEAVRSAGGAHSRCVVLLETCEESGSPDLPAYLEHLDDRLGAVSLVVCLDSGGMDYDRLWLTTSLRGLASVTATVRVLTVGQHSGTVSGVVTSSFRVLRQLLDRIEDSATGEIKLAEMNVEIPEDRLAELRATVESAPGSVLSAIPFAPGVRPVTDDEVELFLNSSWRPTLSIIGASGMPEPADAGNVLRPFTTLSLSFRLPPTADAAASLEAVRKILTTDVPDGAQVELTRFEAAGGWNAPTLAPWLRSSLDSVSDTVFGNPWRTMGMGGSIPFMGLLAERYPDAQFVITGAVGPDSNIHVPDESLEVAHAVRVTEAIVHILDAHARS
ncbi:Acetylornithine deacetylase/Succinyl-diaminopimelate desuccinylase [Actinokineospora alba]|uniref:Acetylornithine deacetylase/Succinyl-diaminopimelate desuccinylase n=1 Tax=Actinokineospora alba TaxID=504798 RepID=A0A1H0Q0U3_9PSEU|nr:M20/M25/M40 family metallo-hydrolase [Actinokineospora alba]TDP66026.1 acetylornithine deacetylase/succinyl-diaminopimelate desuccinylase-like protein [Actinokineospora alba]SDI59674.1 Acetylornithine deacetylase/Succinyl-diaminopimelate desuccinylase [Actinokineospora alba]SDP11051.1 Acetylornithine deacetylase/Succinyl-diaminopimelate desuccinylase [Actinokineospora alba]